MAAKNNTRKTQPLKFKCNPSATQNDDKVKVTFTDATGNETKELIYTYNNSDLK